MPLKLAGLDVDAAVDKFYRILVPFIDVIPTLVSVLYYFFKMLAR